jgi:hypothetical protein
MYNIIIIIGVFKNNLYSTYNGYYGSVVKDV